MQTVNELDYAYRKLVVSALEKRNNTIDISDEEYNVLYNNQDDNNQDEENDINNSLKGTWQGDMNRIYEFDGYTYGAIYSEICFLKDPYSYNSGEGYWYDYYNTNQFTYCLNHIDWVVNNNVINIHFIEEGTYIDIENYSLDNNYFVGTIYNGREYNNFRLVKTEDKNWDNMSFGWVLNGNNDEYFNTNKNNDELISELNRLEFPKTKDEHLLPVKDGGDNIIVIHRAQGSYDYDITGTTGINYSLEYDCNKKAPRWVCYQMNHEPNIVTRTDNWTEDPDIPQYAKFSNTQSMYMNSGYVRGHLVDSPSRLYSVEANRQVFYYSNIMPMLYGFNSGIWLQLENIIRSWNNSTFADTLFIVKGGTIDKEDQILDRIKPDVEGGLIVPKYFFAAILRKKNQNYNAIGFWIKHRNDYGDEIDLTKYVVSIDQLEELTGIDFFCNLPDEIERTVESQVNLAAWGFNIDEEVPEEGE